MYPNIIITIIITIFMLSMVLSYSYSKCSTEISLINGFYEASSEFCEEARIKSFTFYIGNYCNGYYKTYLLMIGNEDDKILINTPSLMILSNSFNNKIYNNTDYHEFNAEFSDLESDFIPHNIKLKFYPKSSKILLCGTDDIIYGCLFKNNILTEIDIIKNKKMNDSSLLETSSMKEYNDIE